MKTIIKAFSPWRTAALALALGVFVGCSDDKNAGNMTPGNDGTARAIVGEDSHLAEPRPAPIGDTAETVEQMDQFGAMPANVNAANREQERLDSLKRAGIKSPTRAKNDNLSTGGVTNNTIGGSQ